MKPSLLKNFVFIYGVALILSVNLIYNSSIILYSNQDNQIGGFYQLFGLITIGSLVVLLVLLRMTNLKFISLKLDFLLLSLLSVLVIVLGLTVSYKEKTESFLLYFGALHLLGIGLALASLRLIYFLIKNDLFGNVLAGFVGLIVGIFLIYLSAIFHFINEIHVLAFICALLVVTMVQSDKLVPEGK